MINSLVSQHEASLVRSKSEKQKNSERVPSQTKSVTHRDGETGESAGAVLAALERFEGNFRNCLEHFDEPQARTVLDRIESLHRQHPNLISAGRVAKHADELEHLKQRRQKHEQHILELAERAISASAKGDHETSAHALRRLSGIHASHPQLLPNAQFEKIRDQITKASKHHEHRLVAQELVQRERAIAAEIKKLAAVIHRFHRIARTVSHDDEEYRRAEEVYHRAVRGVKHHDIEWLAFTILELANILAKWGHPSAKAQEQMDRFLKSVESSLSHLRWEIKDIERENVSKPKS